MKASAHIPMGVGTRYLYDGELIEVVELHSAGLGLGVVVKDRTGRLRRIAVRELLSSEHSRIVADGDGPESNDQQETAATALAMLNRKDNQQVTDHADHVREILTGFRSGTADSALPGEPLPAYAPGVPMMKRYEAKAAELGRGERTVQRWVRLYRANGEAGLIDKRDVRRDGQQRADNRFNRTMLEIMVESTDESKPSGTKVIMQATARATVRYGDGAVWIPSRATAFRDLAELEKKHPLLRLPTKRNRDIAGRPEKAYGKLRATRPGEYLYMDCNRLDVFAFDPLTRKPVTCKLTAALDGYSHCITGLRLTPIGVKSFDVASVLFETLRPLPAKPWWPEVVADARGHPGVGVDVDPERLAFNQAALAAVDAHPLLAPPGRGG